MAKKPWGGAGAWAVEAELAEAQLQELDQQQEQQSRHSPSIIAGSAAFPSLGEAAATKTSKKKKKQTTLSLAQFVVNGPSVFSESKGLTTEEKMVLPSGPRDRSGEEENRGGLGGGFRDYGGHRGEGRDRDYGRDRDGGYGGRRHDREGGFGRGFNGDRDGPEELSRADTVDDWGATKKPLPPSRGRYDERDPSRADDDDNWGSSKRFVPAPSVNGPAPRASKYDFSSSRGGADDVDNWGASKKTAPSGGYDSFGRRDRDHWGSRDRDRTGSEPWIHKDADRPAERPRLVLQPRSVPRDSSPIPTKEDTDNRSTSSEASLEQKPKKPNPFGQAKPRELVLEEKGLSWKDVTAETEYKSQNRDDILKDEIKALQSALKLAEADISEGEHSDHSLKNVEDLQEQLRQKEAELEHLHADSKSDKNGSRFWSANDRKDTDVWTKRSNNGVGSEMRNGVWSKQQNNSVISERKDSNAWSRQSNSGTGSEKREPDVWTRQPSNGWATVERRGGRW
ncbi:hypothetical protein KP509_29G038700 [Ceratopteris richardii]|uniref:Uncharacterized protein n=1 Tax=Ceratopteris richardii TaxID=49495 RepID=A0A8T2R696_CERRI|nr:hypothetical protein KP509_29G038700 [Ceratopteris richardii]